MKILLTRTDNIGDLVLTLSLISLLHEKFPGCEVWFLVRDYAAPILAAAEGVVGWLSWDKLQAMPESKAAKELAAHGFDVVVHVHPSSRVARMLRRSKIPLRIGTSRRLYNWVCCNQRISLRRSLGQEHEAKMNTVLFTKWFNEPADILKARLKAPVLRTGEVLPEVRRLIDSNRQVLIFHPGSNGHGREWAIDRWIQLANQLDATRYQILVSGSAKEAERFAEINWPDSMTSIMGELTLESFINLIGHSHGLVAASTGPLHIAAALGIHALGLYSSSQSRGPWRWRPLGEKAEFIAVGPKCDDTCQEGACPCIDAIEVSMVKARIDQWVGVSAKVAAVAASL